MRFRLPHLLSAMGLSALLCLPAQALSEGREWRAPHLQDHPLVGQIWVPSEQRSLSRKALEARLLEARILLLGEVHGNPDHHALQLELIQALAAADKAPALAMEIFDLENQSRLDTLRDQGEGDADVLAHAAGVEARHWPWDEYRPLVQWALDQDQPLLAANLSGERAMQVGREGLSNHMDEVERRRLGLDEPLPGPVGRRLIEHIVDAHCGYLPAARTGGMVDAQRARDAHMADRLLQAEGRPVVLIAGSGHVRRDYGVPRYLEARGAQGPVLSLAFVEVREGDDSPEDYAMAMDGVYDVILFTPRHRMTDPCDDFREQLEGMRENAS
ncbi:ChaN family lipoprotein [Ectothiorhodospira marina]|uniref:Uncharacterized iron-regulated protein n=1 Tax=Ectothiorhodospira marina TaxID=1396821 RepID=A0A1H7QN29_9GAMM|nr:ChaN family lipoprotein [Ectothiorhodospira marina]SEL48677.1 Uncharacterized iron-regulated protein [Ectothiorhodospira marina]